MKSIKAALKRKSQKDRRQLGDRSAAVCCLGEGRGAALPPWPCWWHTRSLRRALPPPHLPPFWLPTQPGNPWEHLKPRLGAGPILPTQRLMTIPLTPTISHILSTKHSSLSLSLSLSLSISLFPPSPLKTARTFMLYESIWNVKGRSFHYSVRIGFSCALPPASMPTCLMSHKM